MPGMNFHNGCRREHVDLDDPAIARLVAQYRRQKPTTNTTTPKEEPMPRQAAAKPRKRRRKPDKQWLAMRDRLDPIARCTLEFLAERTNTSPSEWTIEPCQ